MVMVIAFIIIGLASRFLPNMPNFSPIAAVALFAGVYSCKKSHILWLLAAYALTDIFLGMHNTLVFTWGSIALIYFFGTYLGARKSSGGVVLYTLFSAITFFVITNFGVWLMGWYPRTIDGLGFCFLNAVPFFRISLVSNLAYGLVFYYACEYWLARGKVTQTSH